jgi:hypothetical protein
MILFFAYACASILTLSLLHAVMTRRIPAMIFFAIFASWGWLAIYQFLKA